MRSQAIERADTAGLETSKRTGLRRDGNRTPVRWCQAFILARTYGFGSEVAAGFLAGIPFIAPMPDFMPAIGFGFQ